MLKACAGGQSIDFLVGCGAADFHKALEAAAVNGNTKTMLDVAAHIAKSASEYVAVPDNLVEFFCEPKADEFVVDNILASAAKAGLIEVLETMKKIATDLRMPLKINYVQKYLSAALRGAHLKFFQILWEEQDLDDKAYSIKIMKNFVVCAAECKNSTEMTWISEFAKRSGLLDCEINRGILIGAAFVGDLVLMEQARSVLQKREPPTFSCTFDLGSGDVFYAAFAGVQLEAVKLVMSWRETLIPVYDALQALADPGQLHSPWRNWDRFDDVGPDVDKVTEMLDFLAERGLEEYMVEEIFFVLAGRYSSRVVYDQLAARFPQKKSFPLSTTTPFP